MSITRRQSCQSQDVSRINRETSLVSIARRESCQSCDVSCVNHETSVMSIARRQSYTLRKFWRATRLKRAHELREIAKMNHEKNSLLYNNICRTACSTIWCTEAKSKNAKNRRFSAFFGTGSLNKKVSKFNCANFGVRHASNGHMSTEKSRKTNREKDSRLYKKFHIFVFFLFLTSHEQK